MVDADTIGGNDEMGGSVGVSVLTSKGGGGGGGVLLALLSSCNKRGESVVELRPVSTASFSRPL